MQMLPPRSASRRELAGREIAKVMAAPARLDRQRFDILSGYQGATGRVDKFGV
jgi:hypothetical protein